MDADVKAALECLSRPTWRLVWADFMPFGILGYFIESAESSDRLPDDVARALLERGYVSQVDEDDPREWRRTYAINDNGRAALTTA